MRRREFIAGLGSAAAWPVAARAQQPALPVIGYLSSGSQGISGERLRMFLRGLSEAGLSEGKNIAIEYRGSTIGSPSLQPISSGAACG